MSIFSEKDYRKALRRTVEERKLIDRKVNFQALAGAMRVQKAYLSRCLQGNAELNSDQLYLGCKFLGFGPSETEFMLDLLELSRCGLEERRQDLLKRIEETQAQHLKTEKHVKTDVAATDTQSLSEYYLDPITQLVHITLLIPRFQNTKKISSELNIPPARLQKALERLERMNLIQKKGKGYEVLKTAIHLPADSPVYPSWRNELKQMSAQRLRNLTVDNSYSFSAVFTGDEETRKKLHEKFLDFLKEAYELMKTAPDEETYQMSFDLFPWTGA